MNPNTAHVVVTPENAITYGAHFLCTSTMHLTVAGVVHCAVSGELITNASHATEVIRMAQRIMRMWCMCVSTDEEEGTDISPFSSAITDNERQADMSNEHLPDFTSWQGIETVLVVGNMLELQKVLDPRAYTVGRDNEWTELAEKEFLLARNWFTSIKRWISCNYIASLDGKPINWQNIWDVSSHANSFE